MSEQTGLNTEDKRLIKLCGIPALFVFVAIVAGMTIHSYQLNTQEHDIWDMAKATITVDHGQVGTVEPEYKKVELLVQTSDGNRLNSSATVSTVWRQGDTLNVYRQIGTTNFYVPADLANKGKDTPYTSVWGNLIGALILGVIAFMVTVFVLYCIFDTQHDMRYNKEHLSPSSV